MAKHEINKENVINDIILTVSLIISVLFVKFVMWITKLDTSEYENIIFFVSSFICIKLIYNIAMHNIVRKKIK